MTLLYFAELTKLFTRPSTRVAAIGLTALGLSGPLLLEIVSGSGITVNGGDLGAQIDVCAANGVAWSLWTRGYYVMQAVLLLLASQSFAGELTGHTLREELLRPVSRTHVLLAKLGALSTFSLVSNLAAFLVSALPALLLLPSTGEATWAAAFAGLAGAWACETGFAVFALSVSVLTRSVAGGLATAFLFVIADRMLGLTLAFGSWVIASLPPQLAEVPPALDTLFRAAPFLPSAGWTAWQTLAQGDPVIWQHWVALAGWTILCATVADRWFAASDIP